MDTEVNHDHWVGRIRIKMEHFQGAQDGGGEDYNINKVY